MSKLESPVPSARPEDETTPTLDDIRALRAVVTWAGNRDRQPPRDPDFEAADRALSWFEDHSAALLATQEDTRLLNAISKPGAATQVGSDFANAGVPIGPSMCAHVCGATLRDAIDSALGSASGAASTSAPTSEDRRPNEP
jgi:hypothetical protein